MLDKVSCFSAQGQQNSLTCPAFVDGVMAALTLRLDNSTFNECGIQPSTAWCSITSRNGLSDELCRMAIPCNMNFPEECKCTGVTRTGIITYHLDFVSYTAEHMGGSFSCDYDCTITVPGQRKVPVVMDASCSNITVGKYCLFNTIVRL